MLFISIDKKYAAQWDEILYNLSLFEFAKLYDFRLYD